MNEEYKCVSAMLMCIGYLYHGVKPIENFNEWERLLVDDLTMEMIVTNGGYLLRWV